MDRPPILRFTASGTPDPIQAWFWEGFRAALQARGHRLQEAPDETTDLVVNFARVDAPRPILQDLPSSRTKVLTVVTVEARPEDPLAAGYPLLPLNLCSLLLLLVGRSNPPETSFLLTLEQGHPEIPVGDPEAYFQEVARRVEARAGATWAFDNLFREDLPPELWEGTPITGQMTLAGMLLDALHLLPPPFPLDDYLTPRQRRFVRLAYRLFGLSYGNVSARARHPALADGTAFWMSASGVDKSRLRRVGEEILLVGGVEEGKVVVRIPPGKPHRRVSVDAVEHYLIYDQNPAVGAILHVHAWPEAVDPALTLVETTPYQAYPCGSLEIARLTARRVGEAPDPAAVVVAQANHGVVITGPSLPEIFLRLQEGRIRLTPRIPQR